MGKNIDLLINAARTQTSHSSLTFDSIADIRTEIRSRRKSIIGSYISLCALVCNEKGLDGEAVAALSDYLVERTIALWYAPLRKKSDFCYFFYRVAIYAIAGGEVGNESIDDIIQLCECLVRSKDTFKTVAKELLPDNMISEMFLLLEEFEEDYYVPNFEDAVMGAVAAFLGTLTDPISEGDESI